jgi:hypothetical protein
MNQDDQRFVLMAAAAQAHYAKQQARREARKAALLSQVLECGFAWRASRSTASTSDNRYLTIRSENPAG